jgi:D-glycero-beta-D-manno-heptose-7-phosphate kinase
VKPAIALNRSTIKKLTKIIDTMYTARILVIGDFILDQYIWGDVSRISPEAPVPVVDVKKETFVPGGALNVGYNIQTLGATVLPCGIIGRDRRGRNFLKIVKRKGISTEGIVIDATRPTTLKTRVIAHSQQVVRFDRESRVDISEKIKKEIIAYCRSAIKNVDGVIIEDYGKGLIFPELITQIVREAKKNDVFVAVDPKEKNFEFYKNVTIITPNKKEAFGAVGASCDDPSVTVEDVGKKFLKKIGAQAVLITLGEEGMALFDETGSVFRIPTVAREVFEVSGAGDTVIAVLSLALSCGATFHQAAIISNFAAGIVVGKVGTVAVTKEELLDSLNSHI